MNAITKKVTGVGPRDAAPEGVHYAFWGSVIGLVAGVVTLFAASIAYGSMTGLGAADCVLLGSVMTVLLSQPAALAGLLMGALCGGICAVIAHFVHH